MCTKTLLRISSQCGACTAWTRKKQTDTQTHKTYICIGVCVPNVLSCARRNIGIVSKNQKNKKKGRRKICIEIELMLFVYIYVFVCVSV